MTQTFFCDLSRDNIITMGKQVMITNYILQITFDYNLITTCKLYLGLNVLHSDVTQ